MVDTDLIFDGKTRSHNLIAHIMAIPKILLIGNVCRYSSLKLLLPNKINRHQTFGTLSYKWP